MALEFTYQPPDYNFSLDPIEFEIRSGKISGGVPTEDNLFCLIKINEMIDPITDRLIAKKYVPYDRTTGKAKVDVHSVLNLYPTLPKLTSTLLDPDANLRGQATDSFMNIKVFAYDSYGIPATYLTGIESDLKHVIYGSSRTILSTLPTGGFDLHAYVDNEGQAFAKPVSKSQPDWLYFVLLGTGTISVDVVVTLEYDDGTTSSYTSGTYSFDDNPMNNWVATGYMQLDIDSHATSGKTVATYKVEIKQGGVAITSVRYVVDYETDWETFLVMDNGLGGIESVRMAGKYSIDVTGERSIALQEWDKNNYAAGSKKQYNAKGREVWTMRTGWTDNAAYIDHLRQMIVGNIWIIDPVLGFVKMICKSSDLKEVRRADQVLYALEIKIETGFDEEAMSNFYKKWVVA